MRARGNSGGDISFTNTFTINHLHEDHHPASAIFARDTPEAAIMQEAVAWWSMNGKWCTKELETNWRLLDQR
jgi:hypothetical protein